MFSRKVPPSLIGLEHVVAADVSRIMACHKIGLFDEPGHVHRALTETQMACGNTAGLFRIVYEISLGVHIGVVTDDL